MVDKMPKVMMDTRDVRQISFVLSIHFVCMTYFNMDGVSYIS